jgi:segregation and condensation protein B
MTATSTNTDINTNIKALIEAAIFSVKKPISSGRIKHTILADTDISPRQITDIIIELQSEYQDRGINLLATASGYQFVTDPGLSASLAILWQEKAPRYSRAVLETLALVAYKQPITRGEIEQLRGVAVSSHIMKTLIERQWVKVVGQKEVPGKPSLYGTTHQFLDYFGLDKLAQLPVLSDNQLEAAISDFEQQQVSP